MLILRSLFNIHRNIAEHRLLFQQSDVIFVIITILKMFLERNLKIFLKFQFSKLLSILCDLVVHFLRLF